MLKFNDIRYLILSKEFSRRELSLITGSILNTKSRGRSVPKQPTNPGKYKFKDKSNACWNYGHYEHVRVDCRTPKKKLEKAEDKESMNITEEINNTYLKREQSNRI